MDENDRLKIIIAFIAHITAVLFIDAVLPNRTEAELELDQIRRVIALIIRAIILLYSIDNKWDLSICITISIFITIWVIVLRLSIETKAKETKL